MMKIEWIKVDGMMVAIDKATGEILDESLTTLPADYDVSKAVVDVLEDMFGDSVITTSLLDKSKTGPKPKQVSNPYASYFSNVQYREDTGSSNMIDALDDLVYSASTASTGNTRIPVKQLVHVMRAEELSTKGVQGTLGKRRIIKGEKAPGKRYCQQILEAAEHLIKRIDMHQERGTINLNDSSAFQSDADSVAYERSQGVVNAMLCPVEFTEGDRRTIRALARAGNIEAINDYLQRVTEQSGRMMQRILGKPLSKDSKQAYDQLDAEFPYEPYEDDNGYVMRRKKLTSPITKQLSLARWLFEVERQTE
ncbi:hypothetical protein [Pantoea sp. S62]|uniref:hypothetical protein n=1 Tax=Pantoea sp. S62 TaxID=2769342 RepID=UPI001912964F|nr:hypothetical protein [Pantoea sp. S62]MBK5015818.1 hypothetical protein [Pantoea sp. S62]